MDHQSRYLALDEAVLEPAIREWRGQQANGGILALVPEAEAGRIPILQAVCRDVGLRLAGGVFPALLEQGREVRNGVRLVFFQNWPAVILTAGLDHPGGMAAYEQALADLLAARPATEQPLLFTMYDSTLGTLGALLSNLAVRLEDRVLYAGANVGAESFASIGSLFDQDRVVTKGALALLLPPDSKVAVEHGFSTPLQIFTVTSSQGAKVHTLNDRPAFEVYQDALRRLYDIEVTPENFTEYAVHYPFGVMSGASRVRVRIPVALDEDGTLTCVGDVETGVVLVILKAPGVGEGDCVPEIARRIGPGVGAAMTFYCAGRRQHLGQQGMEAELADLAAELRPDALFGALSLGEISVDAQGDPVFHNAALVCLPLN
jgi:hypothetical protein